MEINWNVIAEEFQNNLSKNFWNDELKIMNQEAPYSEGCNARFCYWWQAHVVDILVDGYLRTKELRYIEKIDILLEGVVIQNKGDLYNNFYDDMEWMALALLRAYDATGKEKYKAYVIELWEDIKTAWNSNMGGGMSWKKDQLDYKNTPANAPAAILAARLFQRFKNEEDLKWALLIYYWNRDNLVDLETGFVWDGLNRLGDGKIDKDWEYTYCQGVFLGAALELYKITNKESFLNDSKKTADAAIKRLTDPQSGLLPDEGKDDCGLFKGIFIRYLAQLIIERPETSNFKVMLESNAKSLYNYGMSKTSGLISNSWKEEPIGSVQLSTQLSGVMLMEIMDLLKC
jgi:predicted alpha-1,6-mannanase (GH76 family)